MLRQADAAAPALCPLPDITKGSRSSRGLESNGKPENGAKLATDRKQVRPKRIIGRNNSRLDGFYIEREFPSGFATHHSFFSREVLTVAFSMTHLLSPRARRAIRVTNRTGDKIRMALMRPIANARAPLRQNLRTKAHCVCSSFSTLKTWRTRPPPRRRPPGRRRSATRMHRQQSLRRSQMSLTTTRMPASSTKGW